MVKIEATKKEWASLMVLVAAGCELLGKATPDFIAAGSIDVSYAQACLGPLMTDTARVLEAIGGVIDAED